MPTDHATTENKSDQFFIIAVTIAANLKAIIGEAKNISLGSMNAKSVVARAGTNARSIQPITDYVEQLAKTIIQQVNHVNEQSLQITQISLKGFSEELAHDKFMAALEDGRESRFIHSVRPHAERNETAMKDIHNSIRHFIRDMKLTLDEIDSSLVATTVATSKFRLEVGINDTEYAANFKALLDNFETSTVNIRKTIADSKKLLNESARKYF